VTRCRRCGDRLAWPYTVYYFAFHFCALFGRVGHKRRNTSLWSSECLAVYRSEDCKKAEVRGG
jgi:hypothetical protein